MGEATVTDRAPTGSGPGRPRDPEVDARILQAAVEQFGERGWAGFSIEAVAKRAGVGKASIYLRWDGKEPLLLDGLKEHVARVADIAPGDVRSELIQLTRQVFVGLLGDAGRAIMRFNLESDIFPEATHLWREVTTGVVLEARAIVRRAIARGELPEDTSVTLLLDTLMGAVMNHTMVAPEGHIAALQDDPDSYVVPLVDYVLQAAGGDRAG